MAKKQFVKCTISYWLDVFTKKNNLSLSNVLQNALIDLYQERKEKLHDIEEVLKELKIELNK